MGMFSDIEYWKDLAVERADEIAKLRAELAEAKKDATRYRWLRNNSANQYDHPLVVSQSRTPEGMHYIGPVFGRTLDTAIDAAMRTTEEYSVDGKEQP